jgi:hypothetical protein
MKAPVIITAVLAAGIGAVAGYFVGNNNESQVSGDTKTVLIESGADDSLANKKKDAKNKEIADTAASLNFKLAQSDLAKRILAGEKLTIGEIFKEPGQMARLEALLLYARGLDSAGLEEALKEARAMPRGMDSMMAMQLFMSRYGEVDPKAAIDYANGLGGMGRGFGTSSILSTWAATDPVAAGKYLADNIDELGSTNGWMNGRMAGSVASEWAKQDPKAALEWAQKLPDEMRRDAMQQVLTEMASSDPTSAIDYVMKMEAGEERTKMLDEVASQYGRQDPKEALTWAASLKGEEQQLAQRKVLESWSRSSPTEAAAHVDAMDADARAANVRTVADSWSWTDAAAAGNWVISQPPGAETNDATRKVVENWMRADSVKASSWVSELPKGDTRDSGIVAMVSSREMRAEPDARAMWAGEISNADTRVEQVKSAAPAWLATDYDAASEWVNSVNIPQEQKIELLNMTPEQLKAASGGGDRGDDRRWGPPR